MLGPSICDDKKVALEARTTEAPLPDIWAALTLKGFFFLF